MSELDGLFEALGGHHTHILISLAAALFTLITFELHHQFAGGDGSKTADPVRIIEAVTALIVLVVLAKLELRLSNKPPDDDAS